MEIIYKVLGKMQGIFEDDKTKQKIQYARIYCSYDPVDQEGQIYEGEAVEIVKIRPEMLDEVEIGDRIKIYYNKFGKVSSLLPVKE